MCVFANQAIGLRATVDGRLRLMLSFYFLIHEHRTTWDIGYNFRDLSNRGKKPRGVVAKMRCGQPYAFFCSGINGYIYTLKSIIIPPKGIIIPPKV